MSDVKISVSWKTKRQSGYQLKKTESPVKTKPLEPKVNPSRTKNLM